MGARLAAFAQVGTLLAWFACKNTNEGWPRNLNAKMSALWCELGLTSVMAIVGTV
jgi:hypothetical protein